MAGFREAFFFFNFKDEFGGPKSYQEHSIFEGIIYLGTKYKPRFFFFLAVGEGCISA